VVPTYTYRCAGCGSYDVVRPMAEEDPDPRCPHCGAGSRRVFSPPAVRQVATGLSRALSAAERSASEPQVVAAAPPSGQRVQRLDNARQASLPRP